MTREIDGHMEQKILDAAEQLFLDRGFALTSTTEIAAAVGCNQALIHYYFRTKERLFEAVFEKKAKIFFSNIFDISESSVSLEEGIRRVTEAHFDMIRQNPRLPFFIVNELSTNPARIETLNRIVGPSIGRVFSRFSHWLAEEEAKGNMRHIEPFDLIASVVSLNAAFFLAAPIVKRARGIDDASFEQLLDARKKAIVDMVLMSLRPLRDSGERGDQR